MTSTATTPGDQRAAGGLPLRQVAKDHPDELVGRAWRGECFPLLTKFIDASGALPVHLHADDETAQRLEGQANGKTEAWHILEAAPGATALCGVKAGFGREQLHTALLQQDFDAVLRRLPVRAGETIYVPGGTPHSFGPDTLVYEIEQTSDIQQHAMHWQMEDGSPVSDEQFQANIKMFMQEVKFEPKPDFGPGLAIRVDDGVEQVFLTAGPYFALERWRAGTAAPVHRKYETAQILSNVGPPVRVRVGDRVERLGRAETLLLPAALGPIDIEGPADVLFGYLPDLDRDVRAPLLAAGYAPQLIATLGEGFDPGTDGGARLPHRPERPTSPAAAGQ